MSEAAARTIAKGLALFASAFWIHYCLVHDIFGLLTVDEIYFAHVFWLMRQGLEPYSDFYSSHLPAYFRIVGLLVPPAPNLDLSFVWTLRALSAAIIAVYAFLLHKLCRREFLYLLPLLLVFITFGRMVEIRPDTVGLLLFNLGWWQLLRGTGRRQIVLAALLTGLALLFSARAAVMIVGMGAICIYLCVRRRDAGTFGILVLLAVGLTALVALGYALDPTKFTLMIRSVYLDPITLMPDLSLAQRLLAPDRLILVAMILFALGAAAAQMLRDKERTTSVVIAGACLTQLVLIAVDPSPFQYVYGWSLLPTLAGIALLGRESGRGRHTGLALAGAGMTVAVLSLSAAATIAAGRVPATGSMLRLTYDPPFAHGELERATTPQLLAMMVSTQGQQGLWNQLPLYREICRRIRGPALTKFFANPICLADARYDWAGLQWPALLDGEAGAPTEAQFETLFATRPPELVAWGKQHYSPPLSPWGRNLLKDYQVYDGFALRRPDKEPN